MHESKILHFSYIIEFNGKIEEIDEFNCFVKDFLEQLCVCVLGIQLIQKRLSFANLKL